MAHYHKYSYFDDSDPGKCWRRMKLGLRRGYRGFRRSLKELEYKIDAISYRMVRVKKKIKRYRWFG